MEVNIQARLVQGSVKKSLIKLTIPMIFGILSMVTFNLVDTYFVGRLGTRELAAISFTFPVVLVINSLALGLGIGASAVISRAIGAGNHNHVKRLTTDSLILSLFIVAFFVTIGLLTIRPLFQLLGAESDLLPYISKYMKIWYLGVIFVIIPMVGNNAIRASGDAKTPGLIMMMSACINMILDPLLIFGIGPFRRLEIAGAALATVFARAMSMMISLFVLYFRKKMITFNLDSLKTSIDSWKKILYIGLPIAGTRIILPLGIGIITRLVSTYGSESVAGFGVSSRIDFFAMAVIAALASVLGPFIGQNLGAGRHDRVQKAIHYSKQFSIGWGFIIAVLFALFSKPIASVFTNNAQVSSTITMYLRIVPIGYSFQGIIILSASALNVFKKPFHAAALYITQMFVLYIPMAILGSKLLELKGIFGALPISFILAGVGSNFILNKILTGLYNHRAEKLS
jgi:putative MATE family efflux protein